MDRNERHTTQEELLRSAFQSMQAGLWTAIPGIIQSFDATKMTCVVQPSIQGRLFTPGGPQSGSYRMVNLPLLLDCPVVFPAGGGFTLTLPLANGDECLVVFSCRCIDAWWQQGSIQPPMELRMHDLSDGFVIPGIFSQPRVLEGVSTTAAQLRTNDGSSFVEVNSAGVKVHAGTVYQYDVHGYGQKIEWVGGTEWDITNYVVGATVNTADVAIQPPGPPS